MGSLVIVGNAHLDKDYTSLVDRADVVMRLNDCKNYSGLSGTKTTIICANNHGSPAQRAVELKSYKTNPLCRNASEFWFPRSTLAHLRHLKRTRQTFPLEEFDDLSQEIITQNDLSEKTLVQLTKEFNEEVFGLLTLELRRSSIFAKLRRSGRYFICPSTGFFAVAYVLFSPQYANFTKSLIGFSFEGWKGHPMSVERRILLNYAKASKLVIYPVASR